MMRPELITGVIDDLGKLIASSSAEALTVPELDGCKTEFRQDSSETGLQTTFLHIRDNYGNIVYKLSVEMLDKTEDYKQRLKDAK